jgi:hypothetical protein
MKYLLLALGLFVGALAFAPTKADAYACARGVYRSGCAGPNGAVVRHHPPGYGGRGGVYVAPRRVYVAPRHACYWRAGVRVCR